MGGRRPVGIGSGGDAKSLALPCWLLCAALLSLAPAMPPCLRPACLPLLTLIRPRATSCPCSCRPCRRSQGASADPPAQARYHRAC